MKFPIPELNHHLPSTTPLEGIFSVYGGLGVGKTTFAIQTALNSIRTNSSVIYFYSKPELPLGKLNTIYDPVKPETPRSALSSLKFILLKDFNEVLGISFNLEFIFLNNYPKKKETRILVIFDSLTDLYKLNLHPNDRKHNVDMNYRLNHILANLIHLNRCYNLEILLVNELSRNPHGEPIMSGGKVMEYWVSYALYIKRSSILKKRIALLSQNTTKQALKFDLELTEQGFKPSE